jgi:hypothetical protein
MQKKILFIILIFSFFCAPFRVLAEGALSLKTEKYSFKPGDTLVVKTMAKNIFGKPFTGRLAVYFEPMDKTRSPIFNEYPINLQNNKKSGEFSTKLYIDNGMESGIWTASAELQDLNGQTAAKASVNFLITGTNKFFFAKLECYKNSEGSESAVVFIKDENVFCRLSSSELPDKADFKLSGENGKTKEVPDIKDGLLDLKKIESGPWKLEAKLAKEGFEPVEIETSFSVIDEPAKIEVKSACNVNQKCEAGENLTNCPADCEAGASPAKDKRIIFIIFAAIFVLFSILAILYFIFIRKKTASAEATPEVRTESSQNPPVNPKKDIF